MHRNQTYNRRKMLVYASLFVGCLIFLFGRILYIILIHGTEYSNRAKELQERERKVKAVRGIIYDRNMVPLVLNKPVCIISVIHNQITDEDRVVEVLERELGMDRETLYKKVRKVTSIERIKTNVDEDVGKRILQENVDGIKVDVEYKRDYPYNELASKVLGFAGGDYQGILGVEAKYNDYLTGEPGIIYTVTDARGVEVVNEKSYLKDPVPGDDLVLTLDYEIQKVCQEVGLKAFEENEADSVSVIAMEPATGGIYAMVDIPEYNLNEPFELNVELEEGQNEQEALNQMWRNKCLNDTYEPGSSFKIITSSIALEENLVKLSEPFFCPGYTVVEDRRIRCHKTVGHGAETFETALMNSCKQGFIKAVFGVRYFCFLCFFLF